MVIGRILLSSDLQGILQILPALDLAGIVTADMRTLPDEFASRALQTPAHLLPSVRMPWPTS
ncbi:hypothetical protein [Azospirillum agricola]|uniref:hypothetical protein n=1 Tax=Azospirillum agricola TaxID=1720247 RepID=UPI000A0EFD89|nr:hypothetical protein [Azospirillum agricola]SMH41619.1 hypothetical protein SAMN02982994_1753 [Azospirillum lipoferum]